MKLGKKFKDKLWNLWLEHYRMNNMCSLCAQSGIIDTTGAITPGGMPCGKKNFCICPNGLSLMEGYQRAGKELK